MNANEKLIEHFYSAFSRKDYKGMQECYADHAVFNDAIFKDLNSEQVKAMWEMLITKGKDLRIERSHIWADETKGSAHWDAYYTFSTTGNQVVNRIDAYFEFKDGKIVKHTDTFNFHTWARQALGISGLLLGWTNFLKKKISKTAIKNLEAFRLAKSKFSDPQ